MEGLLSKDKIKLLLRYGPGNLLANTEGNHYKFYHVAIEGKTCIIHYGRIGKTIRQIIYECHSRSGAKMYAGNKILEKLKGGYELIEKISNGDD